MHYKIIEHFKTEKDQIQKMEVSPRLMYNRVHKHIDAIETFSKNGTIYQTFQIPNATHSKDAAELICKDLTQSISDYPYQKYLSHFDSNNEFFSDLTITENNSKIGTIIKYEILQLENPQK